MRHKRLFRFIYVVMAAVFLNCIGCDGAQKINSPQKEVAEAKTKSSFSYREIQRWEIPPHEEGQAHGLQGIAAGKSGEIFVADAEGGRIVVCGTEGEILREMRESLEMPFALAFDAGRNRLYVADFGADKIRAFHPDGKLLFEWGKEGDGPGEFKAPNGIVQDAEGAVYVLEFYNHRVQKFTPDGEFLLQWGQEAEWGSRNEPPEKMLYPSGIAIARDGNVYVADSGRDRIKVFSPDGAFIRQFGSKGTAPGTLNSAAGLAIDSKGRLHEADSAMHRVQMFTKEGEFLAAWKLPQVTKIWSPASIHANEDSLFVSDVANNRIYKLQVEEVNSP